MYLILFVSLTVVCSFIYFQAPISITLSTASILNHTGSFSYECIYTFNSTSPSSPVVTAATSDSGAQSITCPTPHLAQIPAIPASTGKIQSVEGVWL